MPPGDVQIALPNGPAPTSKTIVGQTAIRPKAVNASFDGSGAAGPFLPCLVITGKEGFEVARIPAAQVAAGASAEVSWFPRVGGAASTTPVAVTDRETLTAASLVTIAPSAADNLTWAKINGSNLLDLTNPAQPKFVTAGVYSVSVTVAASTLMTVGATYRLQLAMFGFDFSDVVQSSPPATAVVREPFVACTLTHFFRANQVVVATVVNHDSVNIDFGIYKADVQRIS